MKSIALLGLILLRRSAIRGGATHLSTVDSSLDDDGLVRELFDTQLNLSVPVRGSQRCFVAALQKLERLVRSADFKDGEDLVGRSLFDIPGGAFCDALTDHMHQALAFELTRCHMSGMGKSMIFGDAAEDDLGGSSTPEEVCDGEDLMDSAMLMDCLSRLDYLSSIAYTQFTAGTAQICASLTNNIANERRERSAILMYKSTQVVANQMQEAVEAQGKLFLRLEEQDALFQEQRNEMKMQLQWHREEIEKQMDAIDRREEVLRKVIDETAEKMQPLFGIESMVKNMTTGFSWLTSFLHFVVALNVWWVSTMVKRARRSRSFVIPVVIVEGIVEFLLSMIAHNGVLVKYNVGKSLDLNVLIPLLRKTALAAQACAFTTALVSSFFVTQADDFSSRSIHAEDLSAVHAELLAKVREVAAETRKEMMVRDERFMEAYRRAGSVCERPEPGFHPGGSTGGSTIFRPEPGFSSLGTRARERTIQEGTPLVRDFSPCRAVPSDLFVAEHITRGFSCNHEMSTPCLGDADSAGHAEVFTGQRVAFPEESDDASMATAQSSENSTDSGTHHTIAADLCRRHPSREMRPSQTTKASHKKTEKKKRRRTTSSGEDETGDLKGNKKTKTN